MTRLPHPPHTRFDTQLEKVLTQRLLGRVRGTEPGPTVITVGGIHGNEPAGVWAALRVLDRFTSTRTHLRGDYVAFAGNVRGLRERRRYISRDLNRGWSADHVERVMRGEGDPGDHETREQRELVAAIDDVVREARGPVYVIDLHTTSADGVPFAVSYKMGMQTDFALRFPLPVIFGLLNQLSGTMLDYWRDRGCVPLAVEGGQNDRTWSIDRHEAVVWIALVEAGAVDRADVPLYDEYVSLLTECRDSLPHAMEVWQRHAISPEDDFRMQPGYQNIHRVHAGEVIAYDRRGEIRAERDGLIFMPLYQKLGDDGFFFGGEVAEA